MYRNDLLSLHMFMQEQRKEEDRLQTEGMELRRLQQETIRPLRDSAVFFSGAVGFYRRFHTTIAWIAMAVAVYLVWTIWIQIPTIVDSFHEGHPLWHIGALVVAVLVFVGYVKAEIPMTREDTKSRWKVVVLKPYQLGLYAAWTAFVAGLALFAMFVVIAGYQVLTGGDATESVLLDRSFYASSVTVAALMAAAIGMLVLTLVLLPVVFFFQRWSPTIRQEYKVHRAKRNQQIEELHARHEKTKERLAFATKCVNDMTFLHEDYKRFDLVQRIATYLNENKTMDYFAALNQSILDERHMAFQQHVWAIKQQYKDRVTGYQDDLAFIDARWKVRSKSMAELNLRQKAQLHDAVDKFGTLK